MKILEKKTLCEFQIIALLIVFVVTGVNRASSQSNRDPGEANRPNIIVMYSDDHTAQTIGAYRDVLNYGLKLDHSPTPNIDRLAENGMRFDNAFVTNSICKPSRAVLLTGLHSHLNGVRTNGESISVDLETFPMLLQNNGYQTAMIGKWHLGTEPQGFDYYEVLHGQGPYYNPTMRTPSGDIDRHGHTSEIITESALSWLKKRRTKESPFFLMYNHKAPHRNWLPGPDHLDDYKDRDLPEPSTLFYDYSGLETAAHQQDMEIGTTMMWGWDLKVPFHPVTGDSTNWWSWVIKRNRFTDEQLKRVEEAYASENQELYEQYEQMSEKERVRWKYQRYVKDYLRVIRGLDDGVGRVMSYLERENLIDNTVVIYAGDQGFFMGENGWFDKRWIYEESMRMPLIVHWPDGIDAGSVNKQLVQNLDLAPTILDLADLEIPSQMQGRSFASQLKGEQVDDWRDAVYYHYYEGPPAVHKVAHHYGLRTDRYTLAHYYKLDEWELFDLEKDPEQLHSVYGDKEYAQVQNELKNKLNELREKYKDDDGE